MEATIETVGLDDKTCTLPAIPDAMGRRGWEIRINNVGLDGPLTIIGVGYCGPTSLSQGQGVTLRATRRRILWGLLPWFGFCWKAEGEKA